MRKRGFTLAELLIVLGIAGVVAAVILPAINGLMPDKTKINYLKVYDELGNNIKSMVADTSLFPILLKEGSTDIDVSRYPLVNNSQPLKAPFKDDTKYSGDKKLCNLLAHTFGADSCNTTSYPDKSSFTTSNGMEWWISQTKREIDTAENKISYQTDIYVDVDSSKKSSNCMYGEENCKQPDRFKFLLAADGRLVPADPVGVHYINTRKNLLKKKFDVEGDVLASLDDESLKTDPIDEIPIVPTPEPTPTPTPDPEPEPDPTPIVPPPTSNDEEEEDIDPCTNNFKNPKYGVLRMQCFDSVISEYTGEHNYKETKTFKSVLKDKQLISLSPLLDKLSSPAPDDITMYFDIGYILFTKDVPVKFAHYYFVNPKYKNGLGGPVSSASRVTYINDWEKPIGKCTIKKGDKECTNYVSLYNPFTSIPSEYDNCLLFDYTNYDLIKDAECTFEVGSPISLHVVYADISPRYDNTNVYFPTRYYVNMKSGMGVTGTDEVTAWVAGITDPKQVYSDKNSDEENSTFVKR